MASNLEEKYLTLTEIAKSARLNLSQGPWDYLVGGSESETTLKRNRQALDAIALRHRILRDVSNINCSSTFLGHKVRLPVCVAPVGSVETFDPDGAAAIARACAAFGVPQFLSSVSQPGLEATAEAADTTRIFQLYVRGDQAWVDDHIKRAVAAGYHAFCFTVDTAVYSRRERDLVKRFAKPWRTRTAAGQHYQAALTWDHMKAFKDAYPDLPLILKGIGTAEDAAIACEHGVEVIYVSNHGGRQLDHGRGTMEVLPEVVAEVGGKATVMVDGGFMRGTDVVKAIAMGAKAVAIGRLAIMGLAAASTAGLERTLEILEDEMRVAMGLMGAPSLEHLDGSFVHDAAPVNPAHVTSALPLLELENDPWY